MSSTTLTLTDPVRRVLEASTTKGNRLYLPNQLSRPDYVAVDKALKLLGGTWHRREKCHIFTSDAEAALQAALDDGEIVDEIKLYQFYETPGELVDEICETAELRYGDRTLEPSAGEGAIASQAAGHVGWENLYCCELHEGRAAGLMAEGFCVVAADFLTYNPVELFDRIVMNPPFTKRQDVKHFLHAWDLLAPGGRIVAVMSAGVKFRGDKLATQVRELCSEIRELPAGTFKESGTEVNTVLVVGEK